MQHYILNFMFILSVLFHAGLSNANSILPETPGNANTVINKPIMTMTPSPPTINANAYILIDVHSGKIIAEKNKSQKLPPASLTKMMTLYVVSNALSNQQINLTDSIRISRDAWQTSGSRMFIKEGQQVTIEELMKGIIVDSGNDACVAVAEHLGGSESGFAEIMNHHAKNLNMLDSNFTDSTGLPDPNHYTTAYDLAILGRSLINDFPQYYHYYKQKWFTYNNIKQPNRNRLLWRDNHVDGVKTGHTDEAGFCLVSSAKQNDMRLLAVLLGSPSDSIRADDSERLLNYGFRFFETHKIYQAMQTITEINIYKGKTSKLDLGVIKDQYITIPRGQYQHLKVKTQIPKNIQAPITQGSQIGELIIELNNIILERHPLYALHSVDQGGFITRAQDAVRLTVKNWFNS